MQDQPALDVGTTFAQCRALHAQMQLQIIHSFHQDISLYPGPGAGQGIFATIFHCALTRLHIASNFQHAFLLTRF